MFRIASVALTLLVLGFTTPPPRPAHAQAEKVTAAEVVDKETLRKFVLWAESVMSQIDDINEGAGASAGSPNGRQRLQFGQHVLDPLHHGGTCLHPW